MSVTCRPSALDAAGWDAASAAYPGANLLQSWEYGAAKAQGGWIAERLEFVADGRIVGLAQVMLRRLPVVGGGLAWCNRGPLGAGLEALRAHYLGRGFYLRVAPAGTDAVVAPGFRQTGRIGWASAVLDLAPPVEALRAGLDGKWRNALAKAERSGLTVESGSGGAVLTEFLAGHARFLAEKQVPTTVTPGLIAALAELAPAGRTPMVYLARAGGEAVGGVVVVHAGAGCEYLAGHSGEAGRKANATHFLLWQAICDMKARGAVAFDVGGLDEFRTPAGIQLFKRGLKGVPYRLAEEIEACPASPLAHLVRWRVGRALEAS